jgi:tRNA(Ile)-lysidine synthase
LKHNIPLEIININEKPKKNFQSWARIIRYNFFYTIYQKYECVKLLLAHHKDDFLETAIMEQASNREPEYFGIKQKNHVHNMNVVRPFLHKYWKVDLETFAKDLKIPFAIDDTNLKPIFERNRIRLELSTKSFNEKKDLYNWFMMSNKILVKKNNKVLYCYKKWEKSDFKVNVFTYMHFKNELVFKFIYKNNLNIKLSQKKIDSIVDFINSEKGNIKYKLSDKYYINKFRNNLVIKQY